MNSSKYALSLLLSVVIPVAAQSVKGTDIAQGTSNPPIHIIKRPTELAPGLTLPGYTPAQLRHGYGVDLIANQGAGQTIAIVDAFNYNTAESDLATFSTQFGLPACTTANGCFKVIYATGTKPANNSSWAVEAALDTQWAHAIAPQAKIMLVEAANNGNSSLYKAVQVAVQNGASVVSMSWGGPEASNEASFDAYFKAQGVTYVASSGDSGTGAQYPAASPFVVSVGGTTLNLATDGSYLGETAWNGSGGGISTVETEPAFQNSVQSTGFRTVPDVSYDADPNTGVAVLCNSTSPKGWYQVGGTSMSAPQWSAIFAIANSQRVAAGKATLSRVNNYLYAVPASYYNDVTSGNNGTCGAICNAGPGYDYVTGRGTPKANLIITVLTSAK
ncbi:MAG: S53 family peptidase [Bryobacteraceae bacterium]